MPTVPSPPPAGELHPVLETWAAGRPIVRCHPSTFGATEFNPTAQPGRFRPVRFGRRVVPTLYGSETMVGALSETVFHHVPIAAATKRVRASALLPMVKSELVAKRDLRLASVHGHAAFHVLKASRAQLIETDADEYPVLALWGQALYDCPDQPDGIAWRCRQDDDSLAVMLFGDRVTRVDLEAAVAPIPLSWGPGLEVVKRAAEAASITLVE